MAEKEGHTGDFIQRLEKFMEEEEHRTGVRVTSVYFDWVGQPSEAKVSKTEMNVASGY